MRIGIDLGGSHIGLGVVDDNGNILHKEERNFTAEDKKNIKDVIIKEIVERIKKIEKDTKIDSIGIGVPGTVDEKNIIKAVNFGIENFPIVEELQKYINYSINLKNDAKCAAIAENKYGCLANFSNAIFLTLGTGIGGAVIYRDELMQFGKLPGSEFGHMIIVKDGKQCRCGKKGCFETYASMVALKNRIKDCLNLSDDVDGIDLKQIVETQLQSNEHVKNIIEDYIDYLCVGISNFVNIFEPEAIGIGGSFVFWEDILLEPLTKKLVESGYLFNPRELIQIHCAKLGNDAGIIGASMLS